MIFIIAFTTIFRYLRPLKELFLSMVVFKLTIVDAKPHHIFVDLFCYFYSRRF